MMESDALSIKCCGVDARKRGVEGRRLGAADWRGGINIFSGALCGSY
jgi:hypothetical protein